MRGDSSRASVIRTWTDNRAAYAETIERIEKRPADELSHTMAKYTFNEYTKAYSASYSAGARIPEMRRDVSAVARVGLLSWQTALIGLTVSQREYFYRLGRDVQYYRNRLWLVSLALALDVDNDVFDEAVGAAEPVWADRLIGLLIQSRRPDFEVGEEFAFKTLGRGLAKVWDAPDPVKAVESYLAKWPSYYKREGWTDAVLNPDLGDMRYFGLWAFEAVGVVKALGLDDTRLLTNEYYPAGILHADL